MHCYASGKVQGVWYRAFIQKEALKLGITGWARNLPDGRVEVLMCGEKPAVLELLALLKQGPELANVKEVVYEELPWQEEIGFEKY
jgi:acylphosphatase